MNAEYGTLKLKMFQKNITIEKLALFLDVHRNTVANKLNGDSSFSVEESFAIKDEFFPEYDFKYLFQRAEKQAS